MLALVARCVAVASVLVSTLGVSSQAHAYCRETVDTQSIGPCIEEPGSARLVWKQTCMTYVFNEDFFDRMPLLSEASIRSTLEQSFQTWADVSCSGRAPFYVEQDPGTTATTKSQYLRSGGNEAVFTARTREEWRTLKHDELALALTLIWHNANTGQILDVDMEFNTGAGRFADCAKAACGRDMVDLQNTATHEAGHLLGLGHSSVDESTMSESAPDGETSKRDLARDDQLGYCSLDLPEFECTNDDCTCDAPTAPPASPVTTHTTACSIARPATQGSHLVSGLGLLALGLLLARRRRSARER